MTLESNMADELENEEDYEMDFRRLKESHSKAGYVEGIQAGEESSLQQGFNEGFAKSVNITMETSKLLGSMSAVLSFLHSSHSKKDQDYSEIIKEIINLKEEVKFLEQKALIECEKLSTHQEDQELLKVNHRSCAEDNSVSSLEDDKETSVTQKQEVFCQYDSCCEKNSGAQMLDTSICYGQGCDNVIRDVEPKGQSSKITKAIDNSSFHNEMERMQKHFKSLVKKKLAIILP